MDDLVAVHPRLLGLKLALPNLERVTIFLALRTRYAIDLFKDVINIVGPSVCAARVNGLLEKIVLLASSCEAEVSDADMLLEDAAAWVGLWKIVAAKSECMPNMFLLTPEQAKEHTVKMTRQHAQRTLSELNMAASLFSIDTSQEMTKKAIIGELVSKEVAMAQEATATFVEGITFSSAAIDANVDQDEVVHCPDGVPNLEAEPGDYTSVTDRIATSKNTIRATMILHAASTAMISKVEANG